MSLKCGYPVTSFHGYFVPSQFVPCYCDTVPVNRLFVPRKNQHSPSRLTEKKKLPHLLFRLEGGGGGWGCLRVCGKLPCTSYQGADILEEHETSFRGCVPRDVALVHFYPQELQKQMTSSQFL